MQTLRLYISKPVDLTWKEVGPILRGLQYDTAKILNMAMTEWYLWQKGKEEIKQKEGNYPSTKLYPSPDKTLYHKARDIFPKMNSRMVTTLVRRAQLKWKTDCKDVFYGQTKSLSSFKKTTPILIDNQAYTLNKSESGYIFSASLFSRQHDGSSKFQFILNTKKLNFGHRNILNNIMSGEFQSGSAQIGFNDTKNKWFINIAYEPPKSFYIGDPNTIVGVSMGAIKSFICSVSNKNDLCLADADEIIRYRNIIRGRRRSIQRQGPFSGRKGRGRQNILEPTEKLQHKERNFRETRYHQYSKMIIDFAVKHNAGIIQMESLNNIKSLTDHNIVLADWALGDLQGKIEYKAKHHGIEIVYADNTDIGNRCSKCGFVYDGNSISRDRFLCFHCGYEDLFDFNKSHNLCVKDIDEIIANHKQDEISGEVRE